MVDTGATAVDLYIGLGSNLGDRRAYLEAALEALARWPDGRFAAVSSIYETAPLGYLEQPAFYNAVAHLTTRSPPEQVLQRLMAIEGAHGRQRSIHWGPRTLDLDLLLYGDRIVQTATLEVPHPHLTRRAFVLEPLLEIAPGLVHPRTGQPLAAIRLAEQGCRRLPTPLLRKPFSESD